MTMTPSDVDGALAQMAAGVGLRPTAELGRAIVERIRGLEQDVDRLRKRTHELQERHDKDTAQMKKRLAYFVDLWGRASDEMKRDVAPGWVALPSAWERAQFGVLTERAEAAEAELAAVTQERNDLLSWFREARRPPMAEMSAGEGGEG